MLVFDRMRMPFETPETAEMMVPIVSTMMMRMAIVLPAVFQPVTTWAPRAICRAPMPSEAAVPNRVAMMARPSMIREPNVFESPVMKLRIDDMSGTRPRRNEK